METLEKYIKELKIDITADLLQCINVTILLSSNTNCIWTWWIEGLGLRSILIEINGWFVNKTLWACATCKKSVES